MISWHGLTFKELSRFWQNLRTFSFDNKSLIELLFILLYSLEQFSLILATFSIDDKKLLVFVISILVIVFFTTFSAHKLVMESRIKLLEEYLYKSLEDKHLLKTRHDDAIKHIHKLYDEFTASKIMKTKNIYSAQLRGNQKEVEHE